MKAPLLMALYAVALVAVGYLTYSVAPPGAKAATALMMSSGIAALMLFCAVASLMINRNRAIGMVGIHLGLILPLVAALGTGMRLPGSYNNAKAFNAAVASEGSVLVQPASSENRHLPHPVAYQTVGIGSTVILSLFAFAAILSHRPKVPPKPTKTAESDA